MLLENAAYKIAWVGPQGSSCRYLLERLKSYCAQMGVSLDVLDTEVFDQERLLDCQRIVLVSPSRADYPQAEVDLLTTSSNIVPWGVVTDSWYIGSRRSGQGPVTHWQQPWFRWWDSWMAWFFPDSARPGSVVTNAFAPVVTALDLALPPSPLPLPACENQLTILCGCRQTARLLQLQAQHVGWTACITQSISELDAASDKMPGDILWDDTLLPCLPQVDLSDYVHELMNHLTEVAPRARLIASLGLEHLHLWPIVQRRDCTELLVKPSQALTLSNYLHFRSHEILAARSG